MRSVSRTRVETGRVAGNGRERGTTTTGRHDSRWIGHLPIFGSSELHAPYGGARYSAAWTVLADGTRVAPGQIRSFCAGRIVDETSRASGVNQAERDFWNREPICSRIE